MADEEEEEEKDLGRDEEEEEERASVTKVRFCVRHHLRITYILSLSLFAEWLQMKAVDQVCLGPKDPPMTCKRPPYADAGRVKTTLETVASFGERAFFPPCVRSLVTGTVSPNPKSPGADAGGCCIQQFQRREEEGRPYGTHTSAHELGPTHTYTYVGGVSDHSR